MKNKKAYTLIEIMFGAAIFTIILGGFYVFFSWTFASIGPQLGEVYCWQDAKALTRALEKELIDISLILAPNKDQPTTDFLVVQKADGQVYLYIIDPLKNLWKKCLTGDKKIEQIRKGDWPYHINAKANANKEYQKPEPSMGSFFYINQRHSVLVLSLTPIAKSRVINEPIQLFTSISIP